MEYFSAALALGHDDSVTLREALGDLAALEGGYRRALGEYEAAASEAASVDLARIEQKLGRLYYRRGDWKAAESYLSAAREQSTPDALRVEILSDLAIVLHRLGDSPGSDGMAADALELARGLGDGRASSRAANVSGLLARAVGDHTGAVAYLERSRDLAIEANDDELQIASLNNLSRTRAEMGDQVVAIGLLEEALALCRALGDRHSEAAMLSNLGDAQYELGLADESAASIRQSAEILSEIGVDGEELIPEVWMLTEW
jgi:tetratricopeptide (TPR) repeat protein